MPVKKKLKRVYSGQVLEGVNQMKLLIQIFQIIT